MLKSYLQTIPCTKFILLEDTLEYQGTQILNHLIKHHSTNQVKYFIFEGNFKRKQAQLNAQSNIEFINCTDLSNKEVLENLSKVKEPSVIILDSLAQVIFKCGLIETYKLCSNLLSKSTTKQLITILHLDLIQDGNIQIFEHLSTLNISLCPQFTSSSNTGRLNYTFRKTGGKIIKAIEDYRFENDNLITEKIKLEVDKIEQVVKAEVNPENLSTFKIGLSETEKKSRDNLILPYLPKNCDENAEGETGGKIIYTLDAEDDWDEEDPDDDLDI